MQQSLNPKNSRLTFYSLISQSYITFFLEGSSIESWSILQPNQSLRFTATWFTGAFSLTDQLKFYSNQKAFPEHMPKFPKAQALSQFWEQRSSPEVLFLVYRHNIQILFQHSEHDKTRQTRLRRKAT